MFSSESRGYFRTEVGAETPFCSCCPWKYFWENTVSWVFQNWGRDRAAFSIPLSFKICLVQNLVGISELRWEQRTPFCSCCPWKYFWENTVSWVFQNWGRDRAAFSIPLSFKICLVQNLVGITELRWEQRPLFALVVLENTFGRTQFHGYFRTEVGTEPHFQSRCLSKYV